MLFNRNVSLFLIAVAAFLAATTPARAQRRRPEPPPPLSFSDPLAAAPGKATEVTFLGEFSGKPLSLWTSFPAEASLIADDHAIRYRVTVPGDTPVGIAAMRLITTAGPANLQLFMIDDLP